MLPRAQVLQLQDNSIVVDKLLPGDIITSVVMDGTGDINENPAADTLMDVLNRAGKAGKPVTITAMRDGKPVKLDPITPTLKVDRKEDRIGLGVGLAIDADHAIVGGIAKDSPAGQPVQSWHDVHRILGSAKPNQPMPLVAHTTAGETTVQLSLSAEDIKRQQDYRYGMLAAGVLQEYNVPRRTNSPLTAASWGIGETRDLIVQFYLTLKRMAERSVPASNLMGPVGIVQAGAKFAIKGPDWLIWFLSMISANLAVVNFLPIPIVDGGLFLFLIIEKLQGKPLSARTQSIAQVVGLALILSVFIFVTWQDIIR
jgi:regulator of sigma E protease